MSTARTCGYSNWVGSLRQASTVLQPEMTRHLATVTDRRDTGSARVGALRWFAPGQVLLEEPAQPGGHPRHVYLPHVLGTVTPTPGGLRVVLSRGQRGPWQGRHTPS